MPSVEEDIPVILEEIGLEGADTINFAQFLELISVYKGSTLDGYREELSYAYDHLLRRRLGKDTNRKGFSVKEFRELLRASTSTEFQLTAEEAQQVIEDMARRSCLDVSKKDFFQKVAFHRLSWMVTPPQTCTVSLIG